MDIFGITGTNGKTTTAYMLSEIFSRAGRACALVGTVTHRIGEKTYEAVNTTPGRDTFAAYLREAEAQGVGLMVTEVSSHALDQGRVAELPVRFGAFMNLTQDHLDYHRSMEAYYQTKKKLFDFKTMRAAIINTDDPYGRRLAEELRTERPELALLPVSLRGADDARSAQAAAGQNAEADARSAQAAAPNESAAGLSAVVLREGFSGGEFELTVRLPRTPGGETLRERFTVRRPGRHHVYDAMAAVGLALAYGGAAYLAPAKEALAEFSGAPGRFELIAGRRADVTAICDYAHTPDALRNLLTTVREIRAADKSRAEKRGRIITVFGCGGDRDRAKRPMMGEIAGRLSDYTILTSDNPRSEDPLDIIGEIEEGMYGAEALYTVVADRRAAIAKAAAVARPGDIIVVAGKGHETYQLAGGRKTHFDDREVLREFLN